MNGRDLIAAGLQPGRELGNILKQLLDEVLETPEKNEKDYLISRAKELRHS